MASKSNTIRDVALSLSAASLIVFTTMFGMKQCSGADKSDAEKDEKLPKIEVVHNNNIVVGNKVNVKNNKDVVANGGNASIKNNSKVAVGDSIVVENNNDIVTENKCGKDTLVLEIVQKQPVQKKKPQPAVVRDTVYVPVQVKQGTANPVDTDTVCSISVVSFCTRGRGVCR